jgi:nitroreductase
LILRQKGDGFREQHPRDQSVAAAATMLVFHQMGLGAVWLVSPIQAKEIETIFQVPPTMALVCLVAVGYRRIAAEG